MIYLFTSDATSRYKQSALNCTCYPRGHIVRFRYQRRHVHPDIVKGRAPESADRLTLCRSEKRALVIYAETRGLAGGRRFTFFPICLAKILQIRVVGSIYYVDVRLGDFVNYGGSGSTREEATRLHEAVSLLPQHPLPRPHRETSTLIWRGAGDSSEIQSVGVEGESAQDSKGYFLYHDRESRLAIVVAATSQGSAWESVIEVLSTTDSMKDCLFYCVVGFFKIKKRPFLAGSSREELVESGEHGFLTTYQIPMGQSVVLKIRSYRARASQPLEAALRIQSLGNIFEGIAPEKILVQSRYDEEKILVACRRVLDSTVGALSVVPEDPKMELRSPLPVLITTVTVPKGALAIVVGGLVFAPLLLSLGPDFFKHLGDASLAPVSPRLGVWLKCNAADLSVISKAAAAAITVGAGWFGLRRLPLR